MTARQKFAKGQRVELSDEWVREGGFVPRVQTAVVRGFGKKFNIVRVQLMGYKSVQGFDMDAWEPTP